MHASMNSTRIFLGLLLLSGSAISKAAPSVSNADDPTQPESTVHVVILGKDSDVEGFPANAVYEEGDLVDGERNGLWSRFHATGTLRSEIHYASGQPFGDYRLYDADGNLYEEGRWEHSMNVGSLRRYWPNGSVQQILAFDGNGVGQGQQRYFHDNGQLEMLVELVDGQESGDLIRLDREGRVLSRTTYSTGHIVQRSH